MKYLCGNKKLIKKKIFSLNKVIKLKNLVLQLFILTKIDNLIYLIKLFKIEVKQMELNLVGR
jgi:hypothetical protein